jgi:hypothetical protein
MAQDEMKFITEDKWREDIWGVEHKDPKSKVEVSKLVFYWGKNVSSLTIVIQIPRAWIDDTIFHN